MKMVSVRLVSGVALALAAAMPGTAAWMRAETPHFVVYSDDKEAAVTKLAEELELTDAVLRRFHKVSEQDGAASNKLTVYVLPNVRDIGDLCRCSGVYGFYIGRADGPAVFTPRETFAVDKLDMSPRNVLLHEYGHHFLLGTFANAYPGWFSEGYAEFFATLKIEPEAVLIGSPPQYRAWGIRDRYPVPMRALLDTSKRKSMAWQEREAVYGKGWLLTHLILLDKDRRAQFDAYLTALNTGVPSVAAATKAFGDLSKLDAVLDTYKNTKSLPALRIPLSVLSVAPPQVRALTAGEAALIRHRMKSVRGGDRRIMRTAYGDARDAAGRYVDDPVAHGWLAEMAWRAGEHEAAVAAADRALAIDPRSLQALLYKGRAQVAAARKAKAAAPVWAAARRTIVAANKIDPDAAAPLVAYYDSFIAEKRDPTPAALIGLRRALQLVPQDDSLRIKAVIQAIHEGAITDARVLLGPIAFNPHLNPESFAVKLAALLDTAPDKAAANAGLAKLEAERDKNKKDDED